MTVHRVLFVCNDTSFFVSHRLPLAVAARRSGVEVHLAALDTGDLRPLHENGVHFHPLYVDRTGLNPLSDAAYMVHLARLIRKLRPALLHTVTVKPVLYGGLLSRLLGVPASVAAMSGLGFLYANQSLPRRIARKGVESMYRFAMRHPNARVIFQNPNDRDRFLGTGLARREDVVLIPGSGVDPDEFPAQPASADPPIVLLPARMIRDKGIGEFAEAARILKREGSSARFVLAGDVPAHNRGAVPEAEIRRWEQEGLVEWWGHCRDMPTVLAAARIVCLPSYYPEGIPKCLIEAAASARAVVTTDTPGCRDIVRDGENGLLVQPRQAAPLAKAIGGLLADPGRCERLGRRGREMVLQEFALDRVVAATMALYAELGVLSGGEDPLPDGGGAPSVAETAG